VTLLALVLASSTGHGSSNRGGVLVPLILFAALGVGVFRLARRSRRRRLAEEARLAHADAVSGNTQDHASESRDQPEV
jgi:hypothetical protein